MTVVPKWSHLPRVQDTNVHMTIILWVLAGIVFIRAKKAYLIFSFLKYTETNSEMYRVTLCG